MVCVGVFFLGFTHLEKQSTLVIHSFARGGYLNSLSADTDDITAELRNLGTIISPDQ